MKFLRLMFLFTLVTAAFAPVAEGAPVGALKQFRVPTANGQPRYIANGADGNRWFTEGKDNFVTPAQIGRITPAGTVTEFPVECNGCLLNDIIQGPGNILYFTSNEAILGRIDTSGVQGASTPMPNSSVLAGNLDVHGNELWITDFNNNTIWRYNIVSGVFTQFVVPTGASSPADVVVDAAGIVWFTEPGAAPGKIGRLNPAGARGAGTFTEIPTSVFPNGIAIATDGQIWFTSRFTPQAVGRLNPANNVVTIFPFTDVGPQSIAASPDGSMWFTQTTKGNAAQIGNNGLMAESKEVKGSETFGITVDNLGNPWYTMMAANKIAEFQLR